MKNLKVVTGLVALAIGVFPAFAAKSDSGLNAEGSCGNREELVKQLMSRMAEEMKPLLEANQDFLRILSADQLEQLKTLGAEWTAIRKQNPLSQESFGAWAKSSRKLDELANEHAAKVEPMRGPLFSQRNLHNLNSRWRNKVAYSSFDGMSQKMGIARVDLVRAGDAYRQEIGLAYDATGGLGQTVVTIQPRGTTPEFEKHMNLSVAEFVEMHLPAQCLSKKLTEPSDDPFEEVVRVDKLKVAAFLREKGLLKRGPDPVETDPELISLKSDCQQVQARHEAELKALGESMAPFVKQVMAAMPLAAKNKFRFLFNRIESVARTLKEDREADFEGKPHLKEKFRREIGKEQYVREEEWQQIYNETFLGDLDKLSPNESYQKVAEALAKQGVELQFFVPVSGDTRMSTKGFYLIRKVKDLMVIAHHFPGSRRFQYSFAKNLDYFHLGAKQMAFQRLYQDCNKVMLPISGILNSDQMEIGDL